VINVFKRAYRKYESRKYRKKKYVNCHRILSPEETTEYLQKNTVCFCRFGDGEIAIMRGESIAFQQYDRELAERLKEIIKKNESGLRIGINYLYFNPVDTVNPYTQKFFDSMAMQRKFMINNCNRCVEYIDAAVTQLYQIFSDYDFNTHFKKMQSMFEGRDVTVICGRNVMNNIKYNALDVCNSVEFILAPSKNAFSQYSNILEKALRVKENRIICVILGPTAKVLVYDLFKEGRIAWDIGHYLKDYDAYMKKNPRTVTDIIQFFKPD
ncbi:MAG: GT-D fold domain-containing protein, partial [Lachnospiraceae bacterium]|nr:GT-D fold domain-containing protein [Lachnospiraceae bacterium]